jgi:hypothetical protein
LKTIYDGERGGYYASEAEAIEAAKRGKANMLAMLALFKD